MPQMIAVFLYEFLYSMIYWGSKLFHELVSPVVNNIHDWIVLLTGRSLTIIGLAITGLLNYVSSTS